MEDKSRNDTIGDDSKKVLGAICTILVDLDSLALENKSLRCHVLFKLNAAKKEVLKLEIKFEAKLLHPSS